jgi:hypothetical protein
MIFATTTFRHVIAVDRFEKNIYQEPCLAVIIPKIMGLLFFNSLQVPPDGSEMSSTLSGVYHR